MKQNNRILQIITPVLISILLTACAGSLAKPANTSTPAIALTSPTHTSIPVTATTLPTQTPIPSTATTLPSARPSEEEWLAMQNPVGALAWSADGTRLAASANSGVYIFDTQTNSMIHSLVEGEFTFPLVMDPQGKRLLAGNQVWDLISGQLLYQLPKTNISAAAFSPDGKTLATNAEDNIMLWDALTGESQNSSVHKFEEGQWGWGLSYSADGNLLYANSSDNKVTQVDLLSGQSKQLFTLPEGSCCSLFSPDNKYMVVNLSDHGAGSKQLWDVEQGETLQDSGNCDSDVSFSAVSPDSTHFIIGCAFDSQLWNIPAGQMIHKFPFMESLSRLPNLTPPIPVEWRSAAFSPDNTKLALGNNFGEILIWDVNTYQLIDTLSIPLP